VGKDIQVLSELKDGRVVAVRNETILGISFHPEISGEKRVHEYFLGMVG
jgi:5'-phosphate synthase pdxT subunit